MDEKGLLEKRQKELEIELEETRSLSRTRDTLLMANIKELNDVYDVLREKLKELKRRDERIKSFEEELIRANKLSALGELAGSIAHEIKNPLIAIQGFAKRIEKTKEPDKIEEYAGVIDKEAGRLSNVLMKLLEFSRMDEPNKEYVDVNEIVDDTVLFMEHHLTRFKNVELVVKKKKDLPHIQVDKIHIQQALVNIIMNAAQAMPVGGVIEIETQNVNGRISISVKDEGAGIKDEDMGKIFEPFFTTKKKGEGTGLGLSLSKRLVEANGGEIDVESKVGEGSVFKILLHYSTEVKKATK
jgi:signal transduction histidine kinase